MPKTHTRYVCQQCRRVSAGFMGKCPQCGSFNSMVEEIVHDEPSGGKNTPRGLSGRSTPHRLSDVSVEAEDRIPVPIGEFARVLGGGLVPGSIEDLDVIEEHYMGFKAALTLAIATIWSITQIIAVRRFFEGKVAEKSSNKIGS